MDALDNVEKNLRATHAERNDARRTMRLKADGSERDESVEEASGGGLRKLSLMGGVASPKDRPQRQRGGERTSRLSRLSTAARRMSRLPS